MFRVGKHEPTMLHLSSNPFKDVLKCPVNGGKAKPLQLGGLQDAMARNKCSSPGLLSAHVGYDWAMQIKLGLSIILNEHAKSVI